MKAYNAFSCCIAVLLFFNDTIYDYDEDDGEVTDIAVILNTSIAQDLSFNVAGGKYKLCSVMTN